MRDLVYESRPSAVSIRSSDHSIIESIKSSMAEPNNNFSNQWSEWYKADPSPYCCYFRITLSNISHKKTESFFVYSFEFKSALDDNLKFSIDKRYSDFLALVTKLKQRYKARCPALPPKLLKKDHDKLELRGRMLVDWLTHICNQRMFFGDTLFKFVGLPKDLYNDYKSASPLGFLTKEVEVKVGIEKNETVKSPNGKDTFTLFEISVSVICKRLRETTSAYTLKRRFNEFYKLHAALKQIFKKYKKPLPELPRKFTFGKNQILKRQYRLENYLRILLNYPDIFEVLAFRMFLKIEPRKFKELSFNREYRHQTSETGTQFSLLM